MDTLHILNGESLRDYLGEYLNSKNYICFNECITDGEVAEDIFSEGFFKVRGKELEKYYGVSQEMYQHKTIEEISKFKDKEYKKIFLWFDKDMFCQINLLTLLAYLNQCNYDGEVIIHLVRDNYWQSSSIDEIIEESKKVIVGAAFEKLYKAVLIEKEENIEDKEYYKQAIKELPSLKQGISLYEEYHKHENQLTRFINERMDWEEKRLVGELLDTFREYGLGDIQYFNLIRKCKENRKVK